VKCVFIIVALQDGEPKDDLNLPTGTEDLEKCAKEIQTMFNDGKGVRVTTITAVGTEMVVGCTEDNK
jgi:hypothetical protein